MIESFSLSADGDLLWTYEAESTILSSVIMDEQGSLYFGTDNGFVHALAIPEPSTIILLLTGAIGLLAWRRRK